MPTVEEPARTDIYDIANRLWETADELRANSHLKASEYSIPVLGLIFLKFADSRFTQAEAELAGSSTGRRDVGKEDYQAKGILYLPSASRFAKLLLVTESENIGKIINDAMAGIEAENPSLKGVLPRTYQSLTNDTLVSLLRSVNAILGDIQGDAFGKVYEYFLGKFAVAEGAKGGEYFTPTSIVRLIVEIIEPFSGKILDPACGSGGMFVQSARFVEEHRNGKTGRLSIYGQERVDETVRLCKMNLAVHGLEGQISQSNTYYEDPFKSAGQFDFVMANPPFNVDRIDKAKLEDDKRFPFGLPKADNGNYIWIQNFYSALSDKGRAGFVMANSAADASGTEMDIRKKLLTEKAVDVIVAVASNFFYTVTLPVTLWFLDRSKRNTEREDRVLFIDARQIFHQIDRAHRDWLPEQIEFLANVARIYRGENAQHIEGSEGVLAMSFPGGAYRDVPGLCAVADLVEIEMQGWSLNPGRYVGVREAANDGIDFRVRLSELNEELEKLNSEASTLQIRIGQSMPRVVALTRIADGVNPGWKSVTLGQVATFRNGINFSSDSFGRGLRLIGVGDFKNRVVPDYDDLSEVSERALSSEDSILIDGDIIAVRSNGNRMLIGRTLYIHNPPRVTHSAFTIRIRVNEADRNLLMPMYLAYTMRGPILRSILSNEGHGTNIANLNQDILRRIELQLPPLATQSKIVSILSAFDDQIANNNLRIKILKDLTQHIFHEWFADYRYPGYENDTLVDSELGAIPEGWKVRPLGKVAEVHKGLSYKGAYLTESGLPMANLKCFDVGGGFRRNGTKLYSGPFKERHRVQPGTLIVANTDLSQAGNVIGSPAIIPRSGFSDGGLITHHLFAIRPHTDVVGRGFLNHALMDGRFRAFARGHSSGTTVLGLRTIDCEKYPLVLPSQDLMDKFSEFADVIQNQAESLEDSVDVLTESRDILLPLLISGDIDVSDLNIHTPEAAA